MHKNSHFVAAGTLTLFLAFALLIATNSFAESVPKVTAKNSATTGKKRKIQNKVTAAAKQAAAKAAAAKKAASTKAAVKNSAVKKSAAALKAAAAKQAAAKKSASAKKAASAKAAAAKKSAAAAKKSAASAKKSAAAAKQASAKKSGALKKSAVGVGSASKKKVLPKKVMLKPALPSSLRGWWHNSYLLDWGIVLALGGGGLGINFIHPPERPFRADDPTISLPLHEDFISEPLLAGLAFGVPIAAFALAQIGLRSGHDFHHAMLGLAEAGVLTFLFTNLLKVTVGRLRPDFLERCQPNASLQCTGDPSVVRKGRRSFPSGHSSIAMVGGVYLSLYLWGHLNRLDGPGSFWRVPVILLPTAGAMLVVVSRIVDNRHHWEDVLMGSLIGAGFAFLGYHLNFPAPWSKRSGKAYLRSRISVIPSVTSDSASLSFAGTF